MRITLEEKYLQVREKRKPKAIQMNDVVIGEQILILPKSIKPSQLEIDSYISGNHVCREKNMSIRMFTSIQFVSKTQNSINKKWFIQAIGIGANNKPTILNLRIKDEPIF